MKVELSYQYDFGKHSFGLINTEKYTEATFQWLWYYLGVNLGEEITGFDLRPFSFADETWVRPLGEVLETYSISVLFKHSTKEDVKKIAKLIIDKINSKLKESGK